MLFVGPFAIYRTLTRPPKYQPKYQTIAHRFLDLQAQYDWSVTQDDYKLLDDIITQVKSNVRYDPSLTKLADRQAQFLRIFRAIDAVLIDRNFIFPPDHWDTTLDEAFEERALSDDEFQKAINHPHNARRAAHMREHAGDGFHYIACEPSALLYAGIAEAMGFELRLVTVPQHVFVRVQLDDHHAMNWDANRGRSIPDDEYIRDWGVEDWQIREGTYMHPLSAREIEGDMYCNIGVCLANHNAFRGLDGAISCLRKAIELDPRDPYGYADLALNLLFDPDPDAETRAEATRLTERAVTLQPNEASFHAARAYAFAADGATTAAVGELTKARQLDPQNEEYRDIFPQIESGHTMYTGFSAQHPIAFWIVHQHGWLYLLIIIPASGIALLVRIVRFRRKRSPAPPTSEAAVAMGVS